MELDLYVTDPRPATVAAVARSAETAGFGGVWFTESSHNPFIATAVAATATGSVVLGTDVAVAFPRSPMVTAQAASDLADLTGGRFVLGLGTQVKAHVERRFSVPFDRPAARLREYVLALRAIFAAFAGQAPLRFDGDFYSFSLLTDFFSPGPIAHPDIPVYLAGVNTGLARVAGEVADGFHVHPVNSPRYLSEVVRPAIAAGAAAAGRDPAAVTLVAPVFTIVGDTDAERDRQRAAVRRQIGFYGTTPTYRPIFEAHGWPDLPDRLTAALRAGDIDRLAAEVTDAVLDAYAVTADWDGLAAALRDRYAGLVDRVLPYAITADLDDPELAARWAAVAAAVRAGQS